MLPAWKKRSNKDDNRSKTDSPNELFYFCFALVCSFKGFGVSFLIYNNSLLQRETPNEFFVQLSIKINFR